MSRTPQFHLYQIQYSDETAATSPLFKSFDVRDAPELLKRETAHFIRFYDEIVVRDQGQDFYGLVSPKFWEKTGVEHEGWLLAQCRQSSDADVILINPHIFDVYKYLNVWLHAESCHPNSIALTQALFDYAGFDYRICEDFHRHSAQNTVYCNYWFAKKSFWEAYIEFIRHLDASIEQLPMPLRNQFFTPTRYKTEACFYPFIFERLLTTFLETHPSFKVATMDLSPWILQSHKLRRREVTFLKHLKPLIDNWEKTALRRPDDVLYMMKASWRYLYGGLIPAKPPFKFLKRQLSSVEKRLPKFWLFAQLKKRLSISDNDNAG